jgi:hypothetical protein
MISYSALTSYGKVTLPSVEVWNNNSDIVKDPPKSIHTRRIIKVGENNDILNWSDDSGSRINEMINVYARGVNPMVSVQYSNHGNTGSGLMGVDGGISGSNLTSVTGSGGKLPYRIMDKGAFRPPILRQEDLLPLSRMPRGCTSVMSKRCRVDQTKKITPDVVEYFSNIHKNTLKVESYSQKSFKKEVPVSQPKNINIMVNQNMVPINVSSNTKKLKDGGDHVFPTLEDTTPISNLDRLSIKKISQQNYIHGDLVQKRNVPNLSVQTNNGSGIQQNTNIYDGALAPQQKRNIPNLSIQTNGTIGIQQNTNIYDGALAPQQKRNIPNLSIQTNGTIGIQQNTNIYDNVSLNRNRPFRGQSNFGINSGGTKVKLNQEKIITGVTLKAKQ